MIVKITTITVESPVAPEDPQVFEIRVPYGEAGQEKAQLASGFPEDLRFLIRVLQEAVYQDDDIVQGVYQMFKDHVCGENIPNMKVIRETLFKDLSELADQQSFDRR